MGVRIGSGVGVPDPGRLDHLDTPEWEKRPSGPFREMQERLRELEMREKYKDTNYHAAKPLRTPTAEQLAEPGASLEREVDLLRDYGMKEPGSYRAAAQYRNAQDWTRSGLKAWTGVSRSQPVAIELR